MRDRHYSDLGLTVVDEEEITVMYWDGGHVSGWGWFAMSLGMLVFWGLVITAVVLLVRSVGRSGQQGGPPPDQPTPDRPTPEQVLAERFARGEIDEAEYRQRLDVLNGVVHR